MEGGVVGAAAVGFARVRPRRVRRPRVRRDPIDVEQLAAGLTEPRPRSERELIVALEAEVERARAARAPEVEVAPASTVAARDERAVALPLTGAVATDVPAPASADRPQIDLTSPVRRSRVPGAGGDASSGSSANGSSANDAGLPLDQVRAWLEQVKDDLRRVQARVEFLQMEQSRLQGQHHIVAELFSSTTPV